MSKDLKDDELSPEVEPTVVEVRYLWECPECKEWNELHDYDLGEYECWNCQHLVHVIEHSILKRQ